MADLIVSFGRAIREAPVMSGDDIRTERIAIGPSSTPGTIAADPREGIVRLYAQADCWVRVGVDPEADASGSSTSIYMASGGTEYLHIERGMKVAVIEAEEASA